MAARKPPTFRSQLLGKLLREYREKAGRKLSEAGEYVQRDQSTMSRLESGHQPIRVPDMQALLRLYGVTDETAWAGMEQLSRDVFHKDWWDEFADTFPAAFADFPWVEERCRAIHAYDALVPHGLVQTREFAQATIRAVSPKGEEWVQRTLDFRMRRQGVLERPDPPKLALVLDESVLYRPIGGREVMQAQLANLAALAGRPNIEIRVLPYKVGAHAGLGGAFQLFEMPDLLSDIAWSETLAGLMYVEADRVAQYKRAYDDLCAMAESPERSRTMIFEAAKDMR